MPEMTPLGWFHTILGMIALVSGLISFLRYGFIQSTHRPGQIYLAATLITAASALGIYNQGGFGIAHVLALLTLGAMAVGAAAERTSLFGALSSYAQAVTYSATFLFHMIPAITDGLLRLPVGNPILDSIESPILRGFYLAFLALYCAGVAWQLMTLRKQSQMA